MYLCNCANGKFDTGRVDLRPTKVDSEGICTNCGFYAVWEKDHYIHSSVLDSICTVFQKGTGKIRHTTIRELQEELGKQIHDVKLKVANSKSYCPNDVDFVVLFAKVSEIPTKMKPIIFGDNAKIYVFDAEGKKCYESTNIKRLSKLTGDSVNTIMGNLRRSTFKTKKGFTYSYDKNFDVVTFLKARYNTEDFNLDYNWKHDVQSYEEEELGINFVEDYYGTWKEKLYS